MAQAGFPWHPQAHDRDGPVLSEKQALNIPSESRPSRGLADVTNSRCLPGRPADEKRRVNGSVKKRADSLRTQAATRPIVKVSAEVPRPKTPAQRIPVRTIPPWIRDAEEDDLDDPALQDPESPEAAIVAQHNHSTSATQRPLLSGEARIRRGGGFPTSSGALRSQPTSRWISFARASAYPRENFDNEKVDPEWLNEHFTDYSKPWLADHDEEEGEGNSSRYRALRRKRRVWYKQIHFAIMRNPFVPLAFRVTVITFAIAAMALGASIFHENRIINKCIGETPGMRSAYCSNIVGQGEVRYERDPSALMSIIVDAVAIVYSVYITYDEYFSKPLGLRAPGAKVRLVLLDLFFIVFQSANLSLAFNSLTVDSGPCKTGVEADTALQFDNVCDRAEALSSVLFISLLAWLFTFSVSILRLVERINTR